MNNDRFKFRFWDNHDNRFYNESEFCLDDLQRDDDLGVFEQCTGIKDVHGKLIFELDKVKTVTGEIGTVVWHTKLVGFAIEFDTSYGKSYCPVYQTQEVIGNIHENKN